MQRSSLGLPDSLREKPVLYVSSHRGFLQARYPGHVKKFMKDLPGQNKQDDQEYGYLDLTTATADQVIDLLRAIILRKDPSRSGTWLPSNTNESEPPPGFITNVLYLPELDTTGNTTEGSHTFAIDLGNASQILPKLKDFLVEKGVLDNDQHKHLNP